MLFGQFDCLGKHATALELGRGQNDFGAQESHHLATLDAEILGHGHDQRITLLGTHHREADAGIAAGRLDNSLTRFQLAGSLGMFDDTQGQAVFD